MKCLMVIFFATGTVSGFPEWVDMLLGLIVIIFIYTLFAKAP